MKASNTNIIECSGLSVFYGKKQVLGTLNCNLMRGVKIGILGPNGAGKSTFLKAIVGLIPYKGKIIKNCSSLVYTAQRQEIDWDFPVTCRDVAQMGLYRNIGWFKKVTRQHKDKALEALKDVGMENYANTPISDLSVGQQQRIFLARAMVDDNADLFLFDEPLAGVDMKTERVIQNLFNRLIKQGKSILCIHHDLYSAAVHFDYGILLNSKLIASGPINKVLSATNLRRAYGSGIVIPKLR